MVTFGPENGPEYRLGIENGVWGIKAAAARGGSLGVPGVPGVYLVWLFQKTMRVFLRHFEEPWFLSPKSLQDGRVKFKFRTNNIQHNNIQNQIQFAWITQAWRGVGVGWVFKRKHFGKSGSNRSNLKKENLEGPQNLCGSWLPESPEQRFCGGWLFGGSA